MTRVIVTVKIKDNFVEHYQDGVYECNAKGVITFRDVDYNDLYNSLGERSNIIRISCFSKYFDGMPFPVIYRKTIASEHIDWFNIADET